MIAITTEQGNVVRYISPGSSTRMGFHKTYGFVDEVTAMERFRIRRRRGQKDKFGAWTYQFEIRPTAGGNQNEFEVTALDSCAVSKQSGDHWSVQAGTEKYFVIGDALTKEAVAVDHNPPVRKESQLPLLLTFAALAAAVLAILFNPAYMPNPDEQQTELDKLLAKQKVVVIPMVKVMEPLPEPPKQVSQVKPKPKGAQTPNQLGFLALLGKKDLNKAMGGMPTNQPQTTAGAGLGGTQGSGGELLMGLGQGVKHATVGNTGTAGLGGIGKAGAGGGSGGQGSSYIGSGGGGKGLSDVTLSEDVELEGGLDRNVIQATIAKYLSQVRACYEQGLRQKPGLTGQVTMNFEIGKEGRLAYAKVHKTSLGDKLVEDCISTRMISWQFPRPVGGVNVKVNYPFFLRPVGH